MTEIQNWKKFKTGSENKFSTLDHKSQSDSDPKIKISPWFTHPEAILGVYDIQYNWSYI